MTGNVKNGFVAQFIPGVAGLHVVLVEYNGVAVGGTPFYCKVNCVCSENILSTENILTSKNHFYHKKYFNNQKYIELTKNISSTKNIKKYLTPTSNVFRRTTRRLWWWRVWGGARSARPSPSLVSRAGQLQGSLQWLQRSERGLQCDYTRKSRHQPGAPLQHCSTAHFYNFFFGKYAAND